MALITDDVKNEIRERADIVRVIGQHVQLRKAGRNYKGLCPFHNEKTPSFNVIPDKQFFHCFGCHKSGDVFTFVMEFEGKSFVEAAKSLAAMSGVTIPEKPESPTERRHRSERARMFEINRAAAEFFRDALRDPAQGEVARRYLAQRGIETPIADAFMLGFAPDTWRALSDHLERHKLSMELAERVGLIGKQPRAGGYYDRFRNRLMCPVVLPGGEIAGFSGRTLAQGDDPHAGAKYINSPESPVYKKSRLLFGLDRARAEFRRAGRAILVEGNFDVISLHQAGFTETVAPLGTALTSEQIDKLRRLADRVVLLYDGDRAGRAAALKSLEEMVAADLVVHIAVLPDDSDPDSFVAKNGREALAALLARAQPGIEYFVHEVWSRSARTTDGRAAALEEAAGIVRKVANPVKRDLITGTLATAMGVDLAVVKNAVNRRGSARPGPSGTSSGLSGPPPGRFDDEPPDARPAGGPPRPRPMPPPPREELKVLAILSDHPGLLTVAEEHDFFSLLTDARLRDMYCAARQGSSMLSAVPGELGAPIAEFMLAGSYTDVQDPKHCLLEAMAHLRHSRQKRRLRELQRQAADAGRRGDKAAERELVREIMNIRKQVD